jgi:hypothetical protein
MKDYLLRLIQHDITRLCDDLFRMELNFKDPDLSDQRDIWKTCILKTNQQLIKILGYRKKIQKLAK